MWARKVELHVADALFKGKANDGCDICSCTPVSLPGCIPVVAVALRPRGPGSSQAPPTNQQPTTALESLAKRTAFQNTSNHATLNTCQINP